VRIAVLCKILLKSILKIQDEDTFKKYLEDSIFKILFQDTFSRYFLQDTYCKILLGVLHHLHVGTFYMVLLSYYN